MRWLGLWLAWSLLPLTLPGCASSVSMIWEYKGTGEAHVRLYRCVATTLFVPSKLLCVTEEESRP
jgi:hypothetical protein